MVPIWTLIGLAGFGWCDWRARTVPKHWFDGWCIGLALLSPHHDWWAAGFWLLLLSVFAAARTLGSADVLAISTLALVYGLEWSLWWVLCACGLAACHHWLAHPATLPFLTHLALAAAVMRIVSV